MRKNLAVLLLALGTGACVTVTGSGSARDMQAAADVGRTRLHSALLAGDMATVDAMLAGAEIRLPAGTAPGQERAIVRSTLGAAEILMQSEGVARCTGAIHEFGLFVMRSEEGPDEYAQLGRYALLWGRLPDNQLELRRVALFDVEEGRQYRAPPCVTVSDSIYESRRVWVAVHPEVARGGWQDGLLNSVYDAGWRPAVLQNSPDLLQSEAQRLGTVFAQFGLFGSAIGAASVGRIGGSTQFRSPTNRVRLLSYTGTHLGLGGGAEFRMPFVPLLRASASAGPALLRLDGSWETPGRNSHEDDESWSAWSVGAAGDVGVILPLGSRFGITARFQHRWYPDHNVSGHLGSDHLSVSFSHSALFLGFGGKVW
ncbi:MAG TPA: hypothetical protein VK929_15945 [Longimicrobiales bacterium]|nr:hypothetical protein [Longimicrobiales bacterium]